MTNGTIVKLYGADCEPLAGLQRRYAEAYPGAQVVDVAIYQSEAFAAGKNLLGLRDKAGRLVGYGLLFVAPSEAPTRERPHTIWLTMRHDPELAPADEVFVALWPSMLTRARDLAAALRGPARLAAEVAASEAPLLAFLGNRKLVGRSTCYKMVRDLTEPLWDYGWPLGIAILETMLDDPAEREAYLAVYNAVFSHAPWSMAQLEEMLRIAVRPSGTVFVAKHSEITRHGMTIGDVIIPTEFTQPVIVGGMICYAAGPDTVGVALTEDLYVTGSWRSQGIGRAMIAQALRYLKARGYTKASLTVESLNGQALNVYLKLGYKVEFQREIVDRTL